MVVRASTTCEGKKDRRSRYDDDAHARCGKLGALGPELNGESQVGPFEFWPPLGPFGKKHKAYFGAHT